MDYYNSIKTSITNRPQEIVELRIQKIVNDLYSNKDTCETYEPLEQQEYYFQTMKIFLQEYKKNHKNVKGMGNIDSFWNITDIITKEDFDPFLKDLKKQEHITKSTYARIKKHPIYYILWLELLQRELKFVMTHILNISVYDLK